MFFSQWGASSSNGLSVVFNGKIGHIDLPVPKGCWDNTLNSSDRKIRALPFFSQIPTAKTMEFHPESKILQWSTRNPWVSSQSSLQSSAPTELSGDHPGNLFTSLIVGRLEFFSGKGDGGKSLGVCDVTHITQVCLLIICWVLRPGLSTANSFNGFNGLFPDTMTWANSEASYNS